MRVSFLEAAKSCRIERRICLEIHVSVPIWHLRIKRVLDLGRKNLCCGLKLIDSEAPKEAGHFRTETLSVYGLPLWRSKSLSDLLPPS